MQFLKLTCVSLGVHLVKPQPKYVTLRVHILNGIVLTKHLVYICEEVAVVKTVTKNYIINFLYFCFRTK